MKNMFKLLIGTASIGVALCTVTSFPLTMNVKNYDYDIITSEVPILKENITFSGSINQLIKSDGRVDDVNNNLETIFNKNKQALIENYNKVNQKVIDSLDFDTEILNWDDWGVLTFDQWKQHNQQEITEIKYNKFQTITFISKNQLKYFLENNIKNILTDYPNARLANADFGVNGDGDLLIPIDNTPSTLPPIKLDSNNDSNSSVTNNNLILKIPSNKITFMPQIIVSGTYGENHTKIQSKEVSVECQIANSETKAITFLNNAWNKKVITLNDKGIKNNTIQLYDKIKDEDVFKTLGWLENNATLENHIDGHEIDTSILDESKIYSDLGINKTTNELLGVKLEFVNGENSRNVSDNNYNGEYKILIETIDKSNNHDISLKIKTYEVVASINQKNNINTPLQLLVPNAYLIDTNPNNGDDEFMSVDVAFLGNKSIEMGWKEATKDDTEVTMINKNLSNQKIFNRFMKRITDAAKEKNIELYNGLTLKFNNNRWRKELSDFKNIVTLGVTLKKGFTFKSSFSIMTNGNVYKYNSLKNNFNSEVSFRVKCSDNENEATIWKNNNKSIQEIANALP